MQRFPTRSNPGAAHRACGRSPGARAGGAECRTYVECRTCGFEPAEPLLLPRGHCPKCHSSTWRRSFKPGGLLIDPKGPHRPQRTNRAGESGETVVFSSGRGLPLTPLVGV